MNEPGGPARGVSAAELGTAVAELQSLVGSVVADVTVVRAGGSDEDLLLVLAGDDAGCKRFVHVALGGTRARLTTTQRRFPKDAFVSRSPHSLLQRELAGARVQHIGATTGERRCALHFATAHGDRRLAIELFGGYWMKPLSNRQLEAHWTPAMIEAFMQLGERYPDIAGEIYVLASAGTGAPKEA